MISCGYSELEGLEKAEKGVGDTAMLLFHDRPVEFAPLISALQKAEKEGVMGLLLQYICYNFSSS